MAIISSRDNEWHTWMERNPIHTTIMPLIRKKEIKNGLILINSSSRQNCISKATKRNLKKYISLISVQKIKSWSSYCYSLRLFEMRFDCQLIFYTHYWKNITKNQNASTSNTCFTTASAWPNKSICPGVFGPTVSSLALPPGATNFFRKPKV